MTVRCKIEVPNVSVNSLLAKMIQSKVSTQKRKTQPTDFRLRNKM